MLTNFWGKSSVIPTLRNIHRTTSNCWNIPKVAEVDLNYLCNSNNASKIHENIIKRKGVGNITLVNELYNELSRLKQSDPNYEITKDRFYKECLQIPNHTHPDIYNLEEDPRILKYVGEKRKFNFPFKEFYEIGKRLNLIRTDQLGNTSGSRSYYLLGELAELEQALVQYFIINLLKSRFQLISVPDILPRNVVESCGMNTKGERTQVYTLDPDLHGKDLCLSGTSEIALAGYLSGDILDYKQLPLKLCAVSRCYRAETSSTAEERGIFRVHEFTKVEMFIAAEPNTSDYILEDIRKHQEEFFESMELHFQVLDMPPHDLGAQAYRKYDIESWMPGRNMFGEISSCSNCTDYQSRRLNIKYQKPDGGLDYIHTLNGTACAIPRLLISLIESHQQSNGTIYLPVALQQLMDGKTFIGRQKNIPQLSLIKHKK